MRRAGVVAALAVAALLTGGCRTAEPLPEYVWQGPDEALRALAARADAVQAVSAECSITIDPPDRGAITLDGAFAATESPARFRVQAWKFDQRVLDLTATDEGLWLWVHRRAGDPDRFLPEGYRNVPWMGPLLHALDPAQAAVESDGERGDTMRVRWPASALMGEGAEAGSIVLLIECGTLTIREMRVLDAEGREVQRLTMDRYRLIQGTPWPTRLTASGYVDLALRLGDIELNPDLPEAAFRPPADAVKRR